MNYRKIFIKNNAFLNEFIIDIYELNPTKKEIVYYTAPNRKMGLSIILKGKSYIMNESNWIEAPMVNVFGLISRPVKIKSSPNLREINIVFNPYAFSHFHNESMVCLTAGSIINGYDVFNKSLLNILVEGLHSSITDFEIINHVEKFLIAQLKMEKEDSRVVNAIYLIEKNKDQSVNMISEKVNTSSVTLRNLFKNNIGVSPKEYMKITRIRDILFYQNMNEEILSNISYRFGYFDQAHFIHDFKSVMGFSPKFYFNNSNFSSDLRNYGRWRESSFTL